MLQQVMTNPGEIIFREVPVPEVKDNQVLVKIMNIGICGSDIHVYHGKHPFTKYPVTQGHEVSGEIAKIGKDVTEFREGQKVTIEPQVYCGECYPCRHGKYNLCEELKVMGFQTTGTASEYFAVDASKVTPIPEEMSYEEGAMIDHLAVAVQAVKQMGEVKGMNIAVLGAGPIGNLVAQSAKGMGAAKVMITDVSDLRLEKAKECGIDVCVNTKEKDFGEAMIDAFGPDKADVIYDCAGNNITMGQAIKYARKGSVIVLVAVFAGMATIDLAVANDHELDIKSTMMYRHDDYVDGIALVNEGKVHLRPLISKTFAFKDYLKAYQYIDDNPNPGYITHIGKVGAEDIGVFTKRMMQFFGNSADNSELVRESGVTNISEKQDGTTLDVVFLNRSASYNNTFGYYYYKTGEGVDPAKVQKYKVFPNVMMVSQELYNESILKCGDKVRLCYFGEDGKASQTFPKGYTVGWFIYADGYNYKNVGQQSDEINIHKPLLTSNPAKTKGQNYITVKDTKSGRVIIGVEDAGNKSYCDLLFYVDASSETSVDDSNRPNIPDNDKPIEEPDAQENLLGTLAFEDILFYVGDYDMNDVVVEYCRATYFDSNNMINKIVDTFTPTHDGAMYENAFA